VVDVGAIGTIAKGLGVEACAIGVVRTVDDCDVGDALPSSEVELKTTDAAIASKPAAPVICVTIVLMENGAKLQGGGPVGSILTPSVSFTKPQLDPNSSKA